MTKNRATGILALVIGGAYLVGTFRIPVLEGGDATGPRAFPYLIAAIVIASGAALLVKERAGSQPDVLAWGFSSERSTWLRIALTIASGIAYGLLLEPLGYLVATFLFMLVVASFINLGRHLQNLIVSAAFAIVSFVSFAVVLQLSVPRGILGDVLPF